jgi:hypothetical protein
MIITVCSSMQFMDEFEKVKTTLEGQGHEVLLPIMRNYKEDGMTEHGLAKIHHDLIRQHFRKIDKSDAVLILNKDKAGVKNYIGGNTLLEMGKAFDKGITIYLLNPIPEMHYRDEIMAMQPVILDGDLEKIR